ncbi:uncharacterized protein CEXT_328201 [Caerostris extrusa]|uniref:Ionotropic glutamate receptor L-glutamate and glycine-binding domain-containing protein n=1 Tax=Caerostris extrusa TaxID=172846 RepID=A0AAV4TJ16_CAEEX|nr:uncharacterized protein CEXT_328201 [Caerostris extrusa]
MEEDITNIKIVYAELPPFVEIINANDVSNPGGIMPAIFMSIAQWMNLNITWIREPEDKYGTWENDTWTGMCGMLFREEVDIILNPLLPSAEYAQVADYTDPVIFEAFTFLSGKKKQDGGLFLYFSVLEPSVWASMGVSLIVISITSALLFQEIYNKRWNKWITPNEKWMLRTEKSCLSFLLLTLITVWIIGVSFLVMTVFQSLLVSKLTIIKTQPVVDSMQDLVSKTKVKGLAPVEVEMHESSQSIPLYEEAWRKLEKTLSTSDEVLSEVSFKEVEKGITCIVHGHLILRSVLEEYFRENGRCDFHLSENYFFPFPLLMGLRKTLPRRFYRKFNNGLARLVASDITGKWFKPIFKGAKLCTSYSENMLKPLELKNIFGVLVIWGAGTSLSVCCFVFEIYRFRRHLKKPRAKNIGTRRDHLNWK